MAMLTAISSLPDGSTQRLLLLEGVIDDVDDNKRDENFPSPVSYTNLNWELSQDGPDHE